MYKKRRLKADQKEFLSNTADLWKERKIDGLEYVRKIRAEWDR